ncbi:SPOR domain-containing protein [Marinimicrobium sp. C6131]|uniref:SPOR domain-containing protein n=1 Tax=Marinimicrobium sp. C6131 TaxID=3022676 RepID=UPI00223DB5B8|nr:SPOR domain-containing protein [Marinimicrobium sp. C6131]UZJ45630.1 SPOR domain-containing protein [Marinimicrobium sp. C6131]
MNSGLKQRLVGAIVLIAIGILVVPSILRDRQVEPVSTQTLIPDRPAEETMVFEAPTAPDNIEPAPEPDTMFMPEDTSQPVVDSLEEAQSEAVAEPSVPETGASTADVDERTAWVIQVASFRDPETARALRDRLQADGYRAYVRSASTDAGAVSRVFIGPKVSRSEAESTKAAIDRALKVDALILRFEP